MSEQNLQKEFKNDEYNVSATINPGCQVRFDIEAKPEAVKKALRSALKEVSKQVSIPGFRKGKAPEQLIQEKYGSQVNKKWREELFDSAFREAVLLSKTYPYNEKSIQNGKLETLDLESGGTLWVEFESMPVVPELNLNAIAVAAIAPGQVEEEEIGRVIEDLRYQKAEWAAVEGRPVQEGDFVDLDIENMDNPGEPILRDNRLHLVKGEVGKWLMKLLIGAEKGAVVEGVSEQDEKSKGKSFTPTRCKITIQEILSTELPPIDDALAQKNGADDLEDLKVKIRGELEKNEVTKAKKEMRQILKNEILKAHPFDVPNSIVKHHAQQVVSQRGRELIKQAPNDPKAKELLEQLQASIYREVQELFRWQFLVRKVVREANIEVSQEEAAMEMIQMQIMEGFAYQKDEDKIGAMYEYALNRLLEKKAADHLLEKVVKTA